MPIDIEIRDALPIDAPAACEVLRRSITELCVADRRKDPTILQRWLSNKTPEIVASWVGKSGNSVLVAVGEGGVLSSGAVTDAGEITLNYVSPDANLFDPYRQTAFMSRAFSKARSRLICRCSSRPNSILSSI